MQDTSEAPRSSASASAGGGGGGVAPRAAAHGACCLHLVMCRVSMAAGAQLLTVLVSTEWCGSYVKAMRRVKTTDGRGLVGVTRGDGVRGQQQRAFSGNGDS
ncbi:MAG: hypothetical protein WDW38_005342 [Sanguina aurantia]